MSRFHQSQLHSGRRLRAGATAGPALQLVDIDKRFGGVHALRGANLEVAPGQIMGLCGENGAGKSTLLKILAGVHRHGTYRGEVIVGGQSRRLSCPADAHRAGVAVVHQELTLVPELTVAQNLMLGREPRRLGLVDDAAMEAKARTDLARFGFADRIDVARPVSELGIGLQQIVEIVRALPQNAQILVLDEPTAALTGEETDHLFRWLRGLRAHKAACVYVSHRLDEVFALCDRITVLRDGATAATFVTEETTSDEVVAAMVGRALATGRRARPTPTGNGRQAMLQVEGLRVRNARARGQRYAIDDLSLTVHAGEIVALSGAMGAGRTALLSALFGCARAGVRGRIRIDGVPVLIDSPSAAIRLGLAYLPEDRKGRGIVPLMSVAHNLALPSLASPAAMGAGVRIGLVNDIAETQLAERRMEALHIVGKATAAVRTLSGGNQQKVVLGKWLEQRPKLLLLDEPTRGVDVGAREEIYGILESLADEGVAILFASSDLNEVLRLAHRILVLRAGRTAGELDAATTTEETIVELATGAACAVAADAPETSIVEAVTPPTVATARPALSVFLHSSGLRTASVLMLLWIGLALHPATRDAFLTPGNLSNITAQVAEIAIIGVGMTFVILTAGIDLSVGAGMAFFGVVAATLQIDHGQPAWIAILAALAVSILVGLWHGLLVARLEVPPFIATLSGFLAYRGLALLLSDARGLSPMGADFAFLGGRIGAGAAAVFCILGLAIGLAMLVRRYQRRRALGLQTGGSLLLWGRATAIVSVFIACLWVYGNGMPVPVLIAAVVTAIGAVLLTSSRLGRYAFAIGGNVEAARLSGIPVARVKIAVYTMAAVLTAVAALISASRTNGVTPGNMGLVRELHVITAVVIGGTSLSGGHATMIGTLLGALIFGTLSNGMNLLNLNSNWQLIFTGMILLGASALDSWSRRSEAQ